jgi:hypothetical protein
MFTLPELKERGWTEPIVWRLLGGPDRTTRDRPSGAPVGLWRVDRVHAAQTTEEWAAAVDAAHEFEGVWSLRCGRRRRREMVPVALTTSRATARLSPARG